jgi:hypothetical protein
MALPPNKEEMDAASAALTEAGVQDIESAKLIAVSDFDAGSWTLETVAGYAYRLKAAHPELWTKPPSEADLANAALAREAFEGKGDAVARSKLVRTIGQDAADAEARKFGLAGVGDFRRIGKAPTAPNGAEDKGGKDKSHNPWRLPPGPEGDAKRAAFIRSCGTKAAAGLAKSAGVDLSGRPLRAA